MPNKSLSPGEVSALLDIPGSTLRRYVSLFGDYLTPEARRKKARQFTDQDLVVLARVRDLASQQGVKLEDIPARLDNTFEQAAAPTEEQLSALALPGLMRQLERIGDLFQAQQDQIASLQEQLAEAPSREELDRLQAQLAALQEQIERSQADRLPWYKRLFGRQE